MNILVTSGTGYIGSHTVLELLIAGHSVTVIDIATCYADPSLAKQELNWQAERNLNHMMRDAWSWQSKNPTGY